MCKIKLPQSIQVGNLAVTQTENCHISIQKEGHMVFHIQSDHPMKLAELINVVKFYREMNELTESR